MNPAAIVAQLENLAVTHPEVVALLADTINAAFHSQTPARAIVRHLIRATAEGPLASELADELSKLTAPDASRVT